MYMQLHHGLLSYVGLYSGNTPLCDIKDRKMVTWFWIVLSFVYCYSPAEATQDYYFSDLCTRGYEEVTVHTSFSGDNVTGILRANRDSPSKNGLNCTLILEPPEEFGVVLGIDQVDLQKSGECEGNLTISQKTNGSEWQEVFKQCTMDVEQRPFLNVSGWFKINYFQKQGNSLNLKITYTTYHESPCRKTEEFKCSTFVCIPKDLKCDGVNNCGDSSDEWPRVSCPYYSGMIVGVFGGAIVVVLGAGYLIHRRRSRRAEVPYAAFPSAAPRSHSNSLQKQEEAASNSNHQIQDSYFKTNNEPPEEHE